MTVDLTFLYDGTLMYVHEVTECKSMLSCSIHHPSEHPLNMAPLHWRGDLRIMERICAHGQHHPDPDDLRVLMFRSLQIHECCGCCR